MSDKDRPKADDGGGADDEDREGPAAETETETETEGKCEGCGRKGKKLPFFQLRKKSKKLLHQKQKQKGVFVNSRGWGRRANAAAGGGWCCLCVRQPKTPDSSGQLETVKNCLSLVTHGVEKWRVVAWKFKSFSSNLNIIEHKDSFCFSFLSIE